MLEKELQISKLISSKIKNELSPEQEMELNTWLTENVEHASFMDGFYDPSKFRADMNRYISKDKTAIWNKVVRELNTKDVTKKTYNPLNVWSRLAVAAIMVCILGISAYILNDHFNRSNQSVSGNDVRPGSNTATLTLSDGKTIVLSNAKKSVIIDAAKIAYNDGTNVISDKDNNELVQEKSVKELKIITPRGGQYEAVLPDGTRVWLNAASSLKFPSKFVGGDRVVTLTGEAYFNVAKDKAHPFKVRTIQQEVEVLGTHFNLNSYTDELAVSTTLFEGAVKINGNVLLKPGQQASLYRTGKMVVSNGSYDVAAWKDGKFAFEDTSLEVVLRQLARWYDVDIVYPNGVPQESFTGYIDRDMSALDALNILKYTKVNFKIEGKKIIVIK